MKKIPTVFVRDEATNRKYVKDEVASGCEWVLAGEGRATRKYDGTCVMFDFEWYARREVKAGKDAPEGWSEVDHDEVTGNRVGWEPITEAWSFWKPFQEALQDTMTKVGTYELCGPKINGNPEGYERHYLIPHGVVGDDNKPFDYDRIRALFTSPAFTYEGLVWHHPDGRMAKLKKRDFAYQGET